jgi:hypothetical protein
MPTPMMADQRVRARGRQAKVPGTEVPNNGRNQQGEYHGEAGGAANLQDEFHRQQRHDAERYRARRNQHPEEIEEARPYHCDRSGQRMGINDGSDRVRGIVEAIDELKTERDDKRYEQEDEGQVSCDLRARFFDIDIKAIGDEKDSDRQDAEEKNQCQRGGWLIEFRFRRIG